MFSDDIYMSLSGSTKIKAENGTYNFTNVTFVAEPGY